MGKANRGERKQKSRVNAQKLEDYLIDRVEDDAMGGSVSLKTNQELFMVDKSKGHR
jgi:hypothetical protein